MRCIIVLMLSITLFCHCDNGTKRPTASDLLKTLEADTLTTSIEKSIISNLLLEGEIAGKYSIKMHLIIEDKSVKGSYFYDAYEELLPIKGAIRPDGQLELSIYDETKEITELFMGKLSDERDSYTGEWFLIDAGAERFEFTLKTKTLELPPVSIEHLTGTYEYTIQDMTSYLVIETQADQTVKFQTVTSYASCTGEVEPSIAYFYSPTQINFYGEEDCYINLAIQKDNTIEVRETVCLYYHGSRCTFDGIYKKVSDKVNWIMES